MPAILILDQIGTPGAVGDSIFFDVKTDSRSGRLGRWRSHELADGVEQGSDGGGVTFDPFGLAETFAALTAGNLALRVDADAAARMVDSLAQDLDFVDLTSKEVLDALKQTRKRGVRGGRIHDFLHAVAAEKAKTGQLLSSQLIIAGFA